MKSGAVEMIEQYIGIRLDKPREQKEQHRQIGDEKSVLILTKSVDPGCDQCRQDKEDIDQIKRTRLAGTEHQVQHHKSILSRHRTDKREQEKNPVYREKRI